MNYKIAVIPGDGIGHEVVEQTIKVLDKVGNVYGHHFGYEMLLAGGCAIDTLGESLPQKTVEVCKKSHAVILGAVGGPKWDNLPGNKRPEAALLGLRSKLELYANLRPAIMNKELIDACPLKPEITGGSIDIMVVRELTGGIYFGKRGRRESCNGQEAYDTEIYSTGEVERIARIAFDIARKRRFKVTSVDKANILESSRLWREVVMQVSKDYPDVELEHMYVDNAAMQLIRNPGQFDVIVTSNMFGDILSDEASMITGSIGMLPSASLGHGSFGLYEPVHGSAPDIAGMDRANPLATIQSAALMLRYSLNLENEAQSIERAIDKVLKEGYRTPDIMSNGKTLAGTAKMGQLVSDYIE